MGGTITRTLLVSFPPIDEELINELTKELLLTYGKDHANLLMRKVALISVDDNCKIFCSKCGSQVEVEPPGNKWNIREIWENINSNGEKICELFYRSIDLISRIEDDNEIIRNLPGMVLADYVNILVILPLYKLSQSSFLPFLIREVFSKLDIPGYNYHIIGLLPDLEEISPKDENYYIRTFSCLSECEKILSEKIDLINSFILVSGKNQNNQILGTLTDILPSFQEFLKISFFNNYQIPSDLRRAYASYHGKPALFSSWGYSTYIYKKDRFNIHFRNRYITKCIDVFFENINKPEDRNLFFTDLDRLVDTLHWTNQYNLLEHGFDYLSFCKKNQLDIFHFNDETVESMVSILDQKKDYHENKPGGYFRSTYLVSLANNYAQRIDESKKIIIQAIKSYLDKDLNGVKKAYALTYALLGKDDTAIFKGEATIDPLNLRTAREGIAEFYKQYLTEETVICLEDIQAKERVIRVKQEQAEELLRKIEQLEMNLYGRTEIVTDIEAIEEKRYFTIDGKKINISGVRGKDDHLSNKITPFIPIIETLPKIVDLRPFMTTVEDQSQLGSCTANALVGAYEYLIKRGSQKEKDFSRLFVYYNGRDKIHCAQEDNGACISDCAETMMENGVCLEQTWQYDISNVNEKPHQEAYNEASKYKVIIAEHFDTDLNLMKKCLAQGYPFIFGLKLYKNFQLAKAKGVVPLPGHDEVLSEDHGRHAMLCVGYSDDEKCFIVRNSWGEDWGDKGYCYIPYEYLANKQHRSNDRNFLLKTISNVEINETELRTHIGKDNGSLFNFRYDIYDLNAYRENRDKLKVELENLIPELDNLRNTYTRQREKVLQTEFRKDAEFSDIEKNREERNVLIEKSKETDPLFQQLHKDKAEMMAKKKGIILRLALLYPAIGLLGLFLIGLLINKIWLLSEVVSFVFNNLKPVLVISFVVLVSYILWASLKYKKVFLNIINHLRAEINRVTEERNKLRNNILNNYDKYFEIRRIHKLYDVFYRFITEISGYVEALRKSFDSWYAGLNKNKDILLHELPEKEFTDTFFVFNAITESSVDNIILKQNVFQDYYSSGRKTMTEFFMDNNDSLMVEDGVNLFIKEVNAYSEKTEIFKAMQKMGIYDFLFQNETLLDFFPDLKEFPKWTLEDRIQLYMKCSSPFIKLNHNQDIISPVKKLELYCPMDNTDDYNNFISELERLKGDTYIVDNRNETSSGIMFFNTISMLPAYSIESVMRGFSENESKDKTEKNKLYISEEFTNYSCVPSDFDDDQI